MVKQAPNDEPASVLLQSIRKEKEVEPMMEDVRCMMYDGREIREESLKILRNSSFSYTFVWQNGINAITLPSK